MGIESETSLELLLLIFARRKIQRTVITEVHLIHPNFTSLETWISIFMRRKRLVSLIYDDCFIHHLQQQPIFLLVWLLIQINIFINLKLFEFWRNCSVPFLRINFDDWMVHINSTSLQTRRWKSFTFSHWWQKFSPCQQSGASLLLHFAFISLLPIPIPPLSRKWRLSKLMMDAVLLKMQLEVFWL